MKYSVKKDILCAKIETNNKFFSTGYTCKKLIKLKFIQSKCSALKDLRSKCFESIFLII